MLKWLRTCAWMLMLILLLGAAGSAWAASDDFTLEEKWHQQNLSSGLKGSLDVSALGMEAPSFLDEEVWQEIRALTEAVRVSFESTVRGEKSADRSATAVISRGEEAIGTVRWLREGDVQAFASDLLTKDEVWYQLPLEASWYSLLFPAAEGEWPSFWHMLSSLYTADADWAERAAESANAYETRLAIWLQSYQQISSSGENENATIALTCRIPVQDVLSQAEQLLGDLYSDPAMLALLRERFTDEENAAYLETQSRDMILRALRSLSTEGEVLIHREYNARGEILRDSISLPFHEGCFFSELLIDLEPQAMHFSGGYRLNGTAYPFALDVYAMERDGFYTGSVYAAYPTGEEDVSQEADVFSAVFTLETETGAETYDATEDLCEKHSSYVLSLRPTAENSGKLNLLVISLRTEMFSRSRKTAPTTIRFSLAVEDRVTDSGLAVQFEAKTAAKWEPESLESIGQTPVQLDAMDSAALSQVRAGWLQRLAAWLGEQGLISMLTE